MERKKKKLIGILLIAAAFTVAGYAVYRHCFKEEPEYVYQVMQEETTEEQSVPESGTVPEKSEEPLFELKNITDEELELLHTNKQELSDMLQEWMVQNMEYRNAAGVEFFDSEAMTVTEEKCSIMMKTIVENGQREEESRVLVLDYYKDINRYNIHP